MSEATNPKLPKIKRSILNTWLNGGLSRSNMSKIEVDKVAEYFASIVHGSQNMGDNVINDIMGSDNQERPEELDLNAIDYNFETLKGLKIFPNKKIGLYQVFAGDKITDIEFSLNPTQLPDRKILYSEYPGTSTRRELETALKFYKLLY